MRGFIEELRHRNVFRVGVAYIIAGWLIAQVVDLAADAFNAPEWIMQMLIVLLLVGLPVALFLAWAYELTPDGVVKAEDLPADAKKDPRAGRTLNRITLVALIVAVSWIAWDETQERSTATDAPASVADKSIAVLPFADFSPGGDQAWFADGLTDEILNALARTRDLRVASRSSSFQYRGDGQNIPEVAAALGVAHILEGSVRRAGDRIRVTAQLIRASDDAHLWSETFDASSDDSIQIQEDIAFEIASLLDTAMDPDELKRMVASGTQSIAAWEDYIRFRELRVEMLDQLDPNFGGVEALGLYNNVVADDSEFAEAHHLMAQIAFTWLDPNSVLAWPPQYSRTEIMELFTNAAAAASRYARTEKDRLSAEILRARMQLRFTDLIDLTRALVELSPDNRGPWSAHLEALLFTSRWDEAQTFARRAAAHDFGYDDGLGTFVPFLARGDLQSGVALAEKLVSQTAPASASLYQSHRIFLYVDRIEEAAEIGRRYFNSADDKTWSLLIGLRQACAEGRVADADELYANYEFDQDYASRSNIRWLALTTLGRNDEAIEVLRPLDTPEMLYALSGTLSYTHFDPRPFPNLTRVLEEQGNMRDDPKPLNFACER